MNNNWNIRTEILFGEGSLTKLLKSHVLIVGVGGVGAYAAEYLCRAGIGNLTIVDGDTVDTTNRNRQLPALSSTIGKNKVDVVSNRLLDINPHLNIISLNDFIKDEKTRMILTSNKFDFIIDAIDTLSPKVHLILESLKLKLNIISSMGAGGKTDPSQVRIADISKTFNCGLSRAVRKKLKKYKVYKGLKTVFSPEDCTGKIINIEEDDTVPNKSSIVGTVSYMPSLFGCFCASHVIKNLIENE
ncbi:MAG TPA: tRNA threonylcarbamoyladenosine dehydratase [Victivallales bacterium]|nr:tRNA threonylcarbamoyladenosine dehydratase [Victivallales bacterium]